MATKLSIERYSLGSNATSATDRNSSFGDENDLFQLNAIRLDGARGRRASGRFIIACRNRFENFQQRFL